MKKGWQTKKLGGVATLQRGFDLPTQQRTRGDYPLISSSGISDTHNKSMVRGPGVVTGRSGSIGNVFFIEEDFWPLNTVLYVKDFHGNDPRFVFHLLKRFDLKRFASGMGVPTLNRNFVHDELVNVPPLPEQQRIVGILEEAFDGIATATANTEKNLQNARALFSSVFDAITTESEQKHWLKTTVAAIAAPRKGSIRTGPFGSQLLHSEFVDEGIAVLGIDNAVANEFRWGKSRFITPQKYRQLERYRVYPEDVLITIMGTCGRCAIVPDDIPIAINTKHLCCITLDQNKCLPGYLHAYFLYHPMAREFLSKQAKGAIMAGLNMGLIEELPLLLPSLERQKKIVSSFDSLNDEIHRLESIYQQKITALDLLKKSLLHQAFSGAL
ncbi:MAG: restriction endonuclease subunit S [Nitrospiraceae bacterium]